MKLSRVKVKNFKSFEDVDVRFNDFNIIIGSNASGKSNLIDVIKFMRDIEKWGLDSAISLQGGPSYLLNLKLGKKQPLYIKLEFDIDPNSNTRPINFSTEDHKKFGMSATKISLELEIKFHQRGEKYTINRSGFVAHYNLEKVINEDGKAKFELFSKFDMEIKTNSKSKNFLKISLNQDTDLGLDIEQIVPIQIIEGTIEKRVIFGQPFLGLFYRDAPDILANISVFDFTPKDIKCSSPIVGKISLDENARNLPVVLKTILKNKSKRERLVNLLSDLLPFIEDLKVTETADKSLMLEIKEIYNQNNFLPSTFLSDGTAHATALITALYFDPDSSIKIFEEPERNMHPELICTLVEHMKSYASKKQVIITTHNTELLRTADADDVLFVSRKECGSSCVERLSTREDVKTFLENEIGINELYANNLLVGY
ncbi:AAA family ATPase [Vibrio alginolyticus]|uniref:AAA family ATPase n=1 Tax=Vibrio alginolyticus TaxID=663 RepID=UPI002160BDA5|nr:AAA family ATPase [Vibrio alginolyticus]MCS0229433.1 AAA family ATPase [Vibrio alginolyticus]